MKRPYDPGSKFRVREAFPSGFFDGLASTLLIRPGDVVAVASQESPTWPAFSLVTNPRGESGWVPKRYLKRRGRHGVVTHDYDTTCLDPAAGETLELVEADEDSGWLWCRDSRGHIGWFPILMLDPASVTE